MREDPSPMEGGNDTNGAPPDTESNTSPTVRPSVSSDGASTTINIMGRQIPVVVVKSRKGMRPEKPNAGAPVSEGKRNISVPELLETCRQQAKSALRQREGADQATYETLGSTLELYHVANQSDENAIELENQFKAHGIRRSKRTHVFTRLIKLVFENPSERTNINRYASTLHYAVANSIKPDDVPKFIKDNGGIVRCSELEKARRDEPNDQDQTSELNFAASFSTAPEVAIDLQDVPHGPFSLILFPKGGGKYGIIEKRKVGDKALARYLAKAKNTE